MGTALCTRSYQRDVTTRSRCVCSVVWVLKALSTLAYHYLPKAKPKSNTTHAVTHTREHTSTMRKPTALPTRPPTATVDGTHATVTPLTHLVRPHDNDLTTATLLICPPPIHLCPTRHAYSDDATGGGAHAPTLLRVHTTPTSHQTSGRTRVWIPMVR